MSTVEAQSARKRPAAAYSWRERLSRIRALTLTLLGNAQGFFTQYPYAKSLEPVAEPYPEVESLLERSPFREFLAEIEGYRPVFSSFVEGSSDPVLARGMFPALDGMACYAAIRKFRPNRVLEIGSGDSTYFIARGLKDNGSGRLTCIDPQPRRELESLDVTLQRRLMTNCDANLAAELEANDILFIDSSHIVFPGMDVDIQFNRMFPRLKSGVVVHIHDIFLPDDYPPHWRARNFTEQNALIGWLMGGFFEVIWPSQYVYTRHRNLVERALNGLSPVRSAGSLWLRRT